MLKVVALEKIRLETIRRLNIKLLKVVALENTYNNNLTILLHAVSCTKYGRLKLISSFL